MGTKVMGVHRMGTGLEAKSVVFVLRVLSWTSCF